MDAGDYQTKRIWWRAAIATIVFIGLFLLFFGTPAIIYHLVDQGQAGASIVLSINYLLLFISNLGDKSWGNRSIQGLDDWTKEEYRS